MGEARVLRNVNVSLLLLSLTTSYYPSNLYHYSFFPVKFPAAVLLAVSQKQIQD